MELIRICAWIQDQFFPTWRDMAFFNSLNRTARKAVKAHKTFQWGNAVRYGMV